MEKETRVNIQTKVRPETAKKIDDLAARLRLTRQEFMETLIEEGIKDNEWIIRMVSSRFMDPLYDLVKKVKRKTRKKTTLKGDQGE